MKRAGAALLLAVTLLSSCGDSGRRVTLDGSSTVFPISEAMAEEFSKVSDTAVRVGFSGTGGGFEKLCRGDLDIAAASRPVKPAEEAKCAANGLTHLVEIRIAVDALTILVNPANDFAQCMTVAELRYAFQAGGAKRWSDIRPEWPNREIHRYFPGPDSGTFDYFSEAILDGPDGEVPHTPDGTASEDDNVLLRGISGDRDSLGYTGFAHYQEGAKHLNAVAVDAGEGCVLPSVETARSGEYHPLSRPLFFYTDGSLLKTGGARAAFLRFALEHADELVPETGYITLPDDVLQAQLAKLPPPPLKTATTGGG